VNGSLSKAGKVREQTEKIPKSSTKKEHGPKHSNRRQYRKMKLKEKYEKNERRKRRERW